MEQRIRADFLRQKQRMSEVKIEFSPAQTYPNSLETLNQQFAASESQFMKVLVENPDLLQHFRQHLQENLRDSTIMLHRRSLQQRIRGSLLLLDWFLPSSLKEKADLNELRSDVIALLDQMLTTDFSPTAEKYGRFAEVFYRQSYGFLLSIFSDWYDQELKKKSRKKSKPKF